MLLGTAAVVVPDMGPDAWDALALKSPTPHLEWREHSIDVPRDNPLRFNDASLPSTGSEGSATSIGNAGDYYLELDPGQTSDGSLFDLRFSPVEHWNGDSAVPSNLSETCPSGPVLTSLTVSDGTLTPAFIGNCVKYTVPDVPYSTRTFTISVIPESGASVSFWHFPNGVITELIDQDTMTDGRQINLDIGEKTIEVSVTKGSLYRDYRLVITRAKPTVSIRALTMGPATEGDTLLFEIGRSSSAADFLAVRVAADELDAISGEVHDDILPDSVEDKSPLYYIEAGESTAILEVETTGDEVWENHSKIEMRIVSDDLYIIDATGGVASTVVQDDEFLASEAVLSVSPNPIGEGMGKTTATLTVITNGDKRPHGKITIPLTTSDGTATSGEDYSELGTTLTFSESDFAQIDLDGNTRYRAIETADISITQDIVDEDSESFNVAMGTPSNNLVALDSGSANTSVAITDDDVTVTPPVLTALTVNTGTLTPTFSSSHFSYTVPDVGYGNHLMTIAVAFESGAAVSFLDSSNSVLVDLDDMTEGHQVSLYIGSTTVKVRIAKGGVTQDYTLVITREKPTVSISPLTTGPGSEGDTLMFELKRSIAAGDVLAVSVAIRELGVDADSDPGDLFPDSEEGASLSYEIAMNETTATLEVETIGDNSWENHSKIEVRVVADDSYTIDSESGTASVIVKDDEFVESEAVLSVTPNPIGEGMGETIATITVTTKGDQRPHGKVTIPLTTSDGTATSGEDYTGLNSTLIFSEADFLELEVEGNTRYRAIKTADISISQDGVDEDDESFSVDMGTPSDTLVALDSGSADTSVTITDDDDPPALTSLSISAGTLTPTFSSSHLSYDVPNVGYGTHLITITATPEPSAEVPFLDSSNNPYDDLDDMADGHQVYLEIGKTTLTVRVVRGDSEQDYSMVITRAKPSVSIRTLTDNPATEGNLLRFEIKRSEAAGDVLEVRVGMDELDVIDDQGHGDILPDDIENTSPIREIEPNQATAVFTVETTADPVWEKHSMIEMSIKPEDWYSIDAAGAIATIVVHDDDFPESEAVLGVSPNPVNEGTGQATATITVTTDYDKMPHGQVSIPITTSNGSAKVGEDYVELSDSLVLAEGNFSAIQINGDTLYQAAKSVDIVIVPDNVDEEAETFNVMMGLPSQSIVRIDSNTRTVSVTIDDDDNSKPTVTVTTLPSPASVLGRGVVTLDGASGDSNEDTLTYLWSTTPAKIGEFGDPKKEDTTWTAPAPLAEVQTVTLILTVTDNGTPQEQGTATAIVTVEANQGPLAEASASSDTVQGDEMIALTGGGSDPEQGLLTYAWSGDGTFDNADAKDTIWTAPPATNRERPVTLTLTVTDELGLKDTNMVQIIVAAVNGTPSFPVAETGERNVDEGSGAGEYVGEPVEAVDEEGDSLTYVLGGMDASFFRDRQRRADRGGKQHNAGL